MPELWYSMETGIAAMTTPEKLIRELLQKTPKSKRAELARYLDTVAGRQELRMALGRKA